MKNLLTFRRVEQRGVAVLLTAVIAFTAARFDFDNPTPAPARLFQDTAALVRPLRNASRSYPDTFIKRYFNPNTATEEQLRRLGLPPFVANNIVAYREGGAVYYTKTKVGKVYGMTDSLFAAIAPYIVTGYERSPDDSRFTSEQRNALSFPFDPNTLPEDSLRLLGLPEFTVRGILKYRAKGPIKTKAKFREFYGIDSITYARLEPFILLPDDYDAFRTAREQQLVNLSTADSATLRQVSGIGGFFAAQIVEYREELGGFYSKDQLLEIPKLDIDHLRRIAPQIHLDTNAVRRIKINSITFRELNKHPYSPFELTKCIIRERKVIGRYADLKQLYGTCLHSHRDIKKLAPYLIFD